MTFDLIIAMVAAIAAVTAVGFIAYVRSVRDRPALPRTGRRDRRSFAAIPDVINGSVGMSMVRRLTRRPTAGEADTIVPPTALTADEVAYRIGVAGRARASSRVGGVRAAARDGCGGRGGSSEGGLRQPGRPAHRRSGRDDAGGLDPRTARAGRRARCAGRRGKPAGAPRPRRGRRAHRPRRRRPGGAQLLPAAESRRATELDPVRGGGGGESDARADPEADSHAGGCGRDGLADALADTACHRHPGANAETDTQADQGRPALHPEADCASHGGAHASANAEADAEAHRETDPQADATPKPKPIAFFSCSQVALLLDCDGSTSSFASTYAWTYGDGASASRRQSSGSTSTLRLAPTR